MDGQGHGRSGKCFFGRLLDARMFPDGNASVARLLVQKMIPSVAPDMSGPHDVAIARFNYRELNSSEHSLRIRLNSTVVGALETKQGIVAVDYVQAGDSKRVTASHCVLACYNALKHHLCPEMP